MDENKSTGAMPFFAFPWWRPRFPNQTEFTFWPTNWSVVQQFWNGGGKHSNRILSDWIDESLSSNHDLTNDEYTRFYLSVRIRPKNHLHNIDFVKLNIIFTLLKPRILFFGDTPFFSLFTFLSPQYTEFYLKLKISLFEISICSFLPVFYLRMADFIFFFGIRSF